MKNKSNYKIYSLLDLPFLETNLEHLIEIFRILEEKFHLKKNSKQKMIDLGSGDGRIVIYAGLNYGIRSIGYEIDSNLIKEAKDYLKLLKKKKTLKNKNFRKIKIINGDFFKQDINKFDFIYIYSLPTMQKFLNHVFKTAKRGAIFISYKYPLKNIEIILKFEYKIVHKNGNNIVETFFYRKI